MNISQYHHKHIYNYLRDVACWFVYYSHTEHMTSPHLTDILIKSTYNMWFAYYYIINSVDLIRHWIIFHSINLFIYVSLFLVVFCYDNASALPKRLWRSRKTTFCMLIRFYVYHQTHTKKIPHFKYKSWLKPL